MTTGRKGLPTEILAALFVLSALLIFTSPAAAQASGQQTFSSPAQASRALFDAVKAGDSAKLNKIFGPDGKLIVSSGDPEEDKQDWQTFLEHYRVCHRLVKEPDGTVSLYLGSSNWPFPVPLVEQHGVWYFDTETGKQEILFRRIGKNELSAIQVCGELVAAEKEHFAGAHPGEAGQYAPRFVADTGEHNGLFHPIENGRPEIGPLLAEAGTEGSGEHSPFHGYYFRVLTRQGKNAPGGAKSYVVDGKMTGGFAFVAYPAEYRSTGVMTFVVGQDGKVFQKDLGEQTTKIARSMTEFNPDSSWTASDAFSQ